MKFAAVQQNESQNGLEDVDGSRHTELQFLQAYFINVSIDNLAAGEVEGILQHIDLVKVVYS